MKTYWLMERDPKLIPRRESTPRLVWNEPVIKTNTVVQTREKSGASEDRSTYSPVTFNEVASKKSTSSSPIKISNRGNIHLIDEF